VKFQYIAEYRGNLTRSHLCRLMGVSERGLHAWKHRPPSHRQRRDMVLLAHIRDQHRLSLGSYGRPRMTEELNELGIRVGQRRVGRLMRQNGIQGSDAGEGRIVRYGLVLGPARCKVL
jgi:transposase InsO family protein